MKRINRPAEEEEMEVLREGERKRAWPGRMRWVLIIPERRSYTRRTMCTEVWAFGEQKLAATYHGAKATKKKQ